MRSNRKLPSVESLPKITLSKHFFVMNCSKNGRFENLQRSPQPFYPKDVNVVDILGNTPLYYAARNGNIDICRFLVEKGALVNFPCEGKNTAFHMAFSSGRVDVCFYLFEKGANPNAINSEGQTPLAFGAPTMLKSLGLEKGVAYINDSDSIHAFDNRPLFKPTGGNGQLVHSIASDFAAVTQKSVVQRSATLVQDRRQFVN